MNKKNLAVLVLGTLVLLSIGITSLLALSITGPDITPLDSNRPTIEDEIICSWSPSADTYAQNITWINGSVIYGTPIVLSNTTNESSLAAGIVRKGESWTCNISSSNTTHNTWSATSFTIKNALPTVPNATDETLYEDQTFTTTIGSTDPDPEDSIIYSLLGGIPNYCTLGTSSGFLSCTPLAANIGAINITFYADDGGNYTAKKKVEYTILEVNDPPDMTLTYTNATEGILYNMTIDVVDEEEDYPINFSMNSNLSSLKLVTTSQNTAYVTFDTIDNAPSYLDAGTWSITINATDTGSNNTTPYDNPLSTQTVIIKVDTVNEAPNITTNLSSINATQGDFLSFTINATDRDVEDNLTFSISSSCSITNPWIITTINGSHNGTGKVNQTITNDHIICRDVTISVNDGEDTDEISLTLNLTNTNDAPILHNISTVGTNTGGNNISNLSATKGILFLYTVNATDVDSFTYEGETLSYSDNTTLFNINSAGVISFIPQESDIGNHSVLITVSDDEGLQDSTVLFISIVNNTAPILNPIGDLNCDEDALCQLTITASDPDNGDTLSIQSNNSAIFNLSMINATAAQTSYTPLNAQVGNYTIRVNVTDQHGSTDSEVFLFSINNVNDAPIIDQNNDGTPDSISIPKSVEQHLTSFRVNVTDEDLDIGLDNLTFNYSFIVDDNNLNGNLSMLEYTDYAMFSFTPTSVQTGNYTINISVTDKAGMTDYQVINFTVLAKGTPPVITDIKPYKDANNITQTTGWESTTGNTNRTEEVTFAENSEVIFDAKSTFDLSVSTSMTYYWYLDGVLNNSYTVTSGVGIGTQNNFSFDYFSAGNHNVTLIIEDERFSQTNWYWNVTVTNLNRAPSLVNDLDNITLNTTVSINNYFSYGNSLQKFYDPDDDLNSDGVRSELFSEGTNLTYSLASGYTCDIVNFEFIGDDIGITPLEVGTCLVQFNATDPYNESVSSNTLWIIVTDVIVEEVQVDNPSTGGGGSSRTRTRFIPFPFEVPEEYPDPIDLIVPEIVTVYQNQTVEIPITLENKWNDTLEGISLSAVSSLNHTVRFEEDFIESLPKGLNASTTLYIDQYRDDSPYSVTITADVDKPDFNDTAVVMINAMEKKSDGENIESRVTFARDLLNDNPECQELNELLKRAEEEGNSGNAQQAVKLINTAVQGCKQLINQQIEVQSEQPKAFYTVTEYINKNLPASIILGAIILIITGFGVSMLLTGRSKKLEE